MPVAIPSMPFVSQKEQNRLSLLLQYQYDHVEEYCNAQTNLNNILIQRTDNNTNTYTSSRNLSVLLVPAISNLQEKLAYVQNDLTSLEEFVQTCEQHSISSRSVSLSLLQQHVERSRRVLKTVYEPYHVNGIQFPSKQKTVMSGLDSIETKTIALASLRASIIKLQQQIIQGE